MQYLKKWSIVKLGTICIATMVCLSLSVTTAWSDEKASTAREIVSKWHDVVVTVKVITEMRTVMKGREIYKIEDEVETVATVIDPSGLAVLSFSNIGPEKIYNELMRQSGFGGEDMPKFNIENKIKAIKMILFNGHEVPAKIVMRDRDLDLAFVRPAKKLTEPVPALELSRDVKPDILDNIVILTRLGTVAGRIPSISMYRIEAIIKKPRIFYLIDQNAFAGKLGAPVFSLDGKVVGLLLLRITKSQNKSMGISNMISGMGRFGILPVILPAEDIAEVATQALEVKEKEIK